MVSKIFVDGEHGTTGLQIRERMNKRDDIEFLSLSHEDRHDVAKRTEMLQAADIAILCLPDDAAREAVKLAEGKTRIIDTSTAHRIADGWVYGFAEYADGQAKKIAEAQFVSNPGCYSTGAIALLAPLVHASLMPADYPVTINAVSGYTGGGKQMIAQMENSDQEDHISQSHFLYALTLTHKHVPEIMQHSRLARKPIFTPSVSRFPQGMLVQIPLHMDLLKVGTRVQNLVDVLSTHYQGAQFVSVSGSDAAQMGKVFPEDFAGRDDMALYVFADEQSSQVNLVAQLDNLGKGASGAAVQNLNLMLGRK